MLCAGTVVTLACAFQPEFGKLPAGQRLERILESSNYAEADGEFRNQTPTPQLTNEGGHLSLLWEYFFVARERLRPSRPLPMLKTDLKALDANADAAVWLGHSSSFLQLGGKSILIDPVFSSSAAPFSFMNRAFEGEYPYSAEDMPEIDCLVISHDHWDHLDYPTLAALKPKIKAVVCPLGVGAHLEHWGFAREIIHEADWHEALKLEPDFTVHVLPARHFSGRLIRRNATLWAGFMLETGRRRVFYSGDSGYGPHFAEIGERFGEVDLAIMENGQYDESWRYIHMMPEEAVRGAEDLRAKALLPVHSGRFSITNHAWDDPYKRIVAASRGKGFRLLTPRIGEVVDMGYPEQSFARWWESELLAEARQQGRE